VKLLSQKERIELSLPLARVHLPTQQKKSCEQSLKEQESQFLQVTMHTMLCPRKEAVGGALGLKISYERLVLASMKSAMVYRCLALV
jgi:hypothetical protein